MILSYREFHEHRKAKVKLVKTMLNAESFTCTLSVSQSISSDFDAIHSKASVGLPISD